MDKTYNIYRVHEGKITREQYLNFLREKYGQDLNIFQLIARLLNRKGGDVSHFLIVKEFMKNIHRCSFEFKNLMKGKDRFILYNLAIYYNFDLKVTENETFISHADKSRYHIANKIRCGFLEKGKVFHLSYLKRNRIHHLEWFECVDKDKMLYKPKDEFLKNPGYDERGIVNNCKSLKFIKKDLNIKSFLMIYCFILLLSESIQ